jgi:erythronate-4-phosphate dehydrogenase
MKIIADLNIPFIREAFSSLGDVELIAGRQINAAAVRDADALLVRSVTPVNAALLDNSRVRFVATATIGTDHIDQAYLRQHGIGFASAQGSNANSVAEYLVAAMLGIAHRKQYRLRGKTLGVVGVGNVGSRVVRYAEALGMRVLQNDPPRERAESTGRAGPARREGDGQPGGLSLPAFVSLDRVCAEADVITLHVPLMREGEDATYHLFDGARLAALDRRPLLINSARGAVVDNPALLRAIDNKSISAAVFDVWEKEPNISMELLNRVDIGTPHIAGYSFDGKVKGTSMIFGAVCRFFELKQTWDPAPLMPTPAVPSIELAVSPEDDEEDILSRAIKQVYDITADDAALRKRAADPDRIGPSFDKLRAEYPVRREFFNTELALRGASDELRKKFSALGFRAIN